ncbi:SRPBCC family protein [Polaromonas eurypsychrophila]|uniref:ATPase n=1 Tax=Polaromonas eurypsychrophila TaxID=1614635 RepID=A0A916S8A3_9BURK|nr:SRPBCC family protein [Polaromonas eurypsychrophila]GGA86633.1 ATPase [Polaromonas eurypsychrophila]
MTNTQNTSRSGNTIELHRVLTSTPEKIWRAFTQPDAFARWLPPNGFTAHVYELDAVVGGSYRMSFTNFTTGGEMFFGGNYLELRPNECIAYTASFEDPNLPGEMTTHITIKPVSVGVEIQITQSGIPAVIPAEACYLGWQESLRHLAKLVEPNIPG